MNTKELREELENIEWYNPTIPLHWEHYHKIIRDLCDQIDANVANQTEKPVSESKLKRHIPSPYDAGIRRFKS